MVVEDPVAPEDMAVREDMVAPAEATVDRAALEAPEAHRVDIVR